MQLLRCEGSKSATSYYLVGQWFIQLRCIPYRRNNF